jgi:hypothetical protein
MSRYFFDYHDGQSVTADEYGLELTSREDVHRAALDALPDIARELLPQHPVREMSIQVRNEAGRHVLTTSLILVTQWSENDLSS